MEPGARNQRKAQAPTASRSEEQLPPGACSGDGWCGCDKGARIFEALDGAELRGRLEAPDPALRLVNHPHHGKHLTKRADRLVREAAGWSGRVRGLPDLESEIADSLVKAAIVGLCLQ
jgi:hypothetical protein